MRLLTAARIVRTLGLRQSITWRTGQLPVWTPTEEVEREWINRIALAFGRHHGHVALSLGREACATAVVTYALAVHKRNRRVYRDVVGGRIR